MYKRASASSGCVRLGDEESAEEEERHEECGAAHHRDGHVGERLGAFPPDHAAEAHEDSTEGLATHGMEEQCEAEARCVDARVREAVEGDDKGQRRVQRPRDEVELHGEPYLEGVARPSLELVHVVGLPTRARRGSAGAAR